MAKDPFEGFPNSAGPQGTNRASKGGMMMSDKKDLPYSMPYGPKNCTSGPGLGADNYGNCGTQGKSSTRMSDGGTVGLGGKNRGMSPTQGKR
jgi:hypothetical protein